MKAYPFDWLIIGYCLLMTTLIAMWGRPLSTHADELAFYLITAALTVIIVRYVDESRSRLHALIRLLYPLFLFSFFYRATGGLIDLWFNEFFDWQLVTFERILLGVNPTLYIDKHLLSPWINELLSLCYFSYYLMLPAFLISLFIRKDYEVIKRSLVAICMMFFISYLLFALYPVEGPRWYFADQYSNAIEGPVFRKLVNLVIENGAVHGGAMPSSHTGVALVITMFCFRHYRMFGWPMLLTTLGLAVGCVWGRFHYAIDVIVGAAIGIFAVLLVWKQYDRRSKERPREKIPMEVSRENVS